MAILNNSNAISSGGYDINNSLRFRASASAYLSRTPASTGNRQTFTYSFWMKRGILGTLQRFFGVSDNATGDFIFQWTTSNTLEIYDNGPAGTSLITTQVFRDPSAWYHIVIVYDTTNATTASRVRVYVNGSQVTAFGTAVYPAQNTNSFNNQSGIASLIGIWPSGSQYFDGYMAEFNFINGQALTPSSFGETDAITGSWVAKKYTGTYGTNGFYLKFSDIATTSGSNAGLGKDFSGNGNYFNTNNISVTSGTTYDAMTDSPTLTSATVANYCVWNPLDNYNSLTISNGNLTAARATTASWASSRATFSMPSGKWYWEVTSGGGTTQVGILRTDTALTADSAANAYGYIYNANDGYRYNNGNSYAYGSAYNTSGDVVGVAFDADTGTLTFYKNGTSQGTAWSGLSGTYSPVISIYGTITTHANFGQRPFAYTPPSGYKALNTYNLPDSTVKKGNVHMDAQLYTGNGSTLTVTNTSGLQPDVVWGKSRTRGNGHWLYDTTRGVGTSKGLVPNETIAEGGASSNINLTAFNSNGFSLGTTSSTNVPNFNGDSYVAWQWKANGGTTSSNTNGSITSTVQANTTAGFSIVTFTSNNTGGATVGHGLGVKPSMVILKRRGGVSDWDSYHTSLGATKGIGLNTTSAATTSINYWNNTEPTSSVFTLGAGVNPASITMVAYCWAEIAGFSKFGSYTGNGSSDGPFIYTGFRPKYVIVKSSSVGGAGYNWCAYDTSRSSYNASSQVLYPNTSEAEQSISIDILSNGFKLRESGATQNSNGQTYIYMAFAENPFKNSNAR